MNILPPLDDYDWLMPEIDRHETEQSKVLGEFLIDLISPQSVIDIGCGSGIYLVPFKCETLGIDGCSTGGQHCNFKQVDLREPIKIKKHDLALCIEVAEHIQSEFVETFMDNVCQHKNICFTAAKPGQGGHCHYNEQPMDYWIEKFDKRGYKVHKDNDRFQEHLKHEVYDHCGWMRNSILMEEK